MNNQNPTNNLAQNTTVSAPSPSNTIKKKVIKRIVKPGTNPQAVKKVVTNNPGEHKKIVKKVIKKVIKKVEPVEQAKPVTPTVSAPVAPATPAPSVTTTPTAEVPKVESKPVTPAQPAPAPVETPAKKVVTPEAPKAPVKPVEPVKVSETPKPAEPPKVTEEVKPVEKPTEAPKVENKPKEEVLEFDIIEEEKGTTTPTKVDNQDKVIEEKKEEVVEEVKEEVKPVEPPKQEVAEPVTQTPQATNDDSGSMVSYTLQSDDNKNNNSGSMLVQVNGPNPEQQIMSSNNYGQPVSSVMMPQQMIYQPMQMVMPTPVVSYQPVQYPQMMQQSQPVIPSFNNQHTAPPPPQNTGNTPQQSIPAEPAPQVPSQPQAPVQDNNQVPEPVDFDEIKRQAASAEVEAPKSLSDVLKSSAENNKGSVLKIDERDLLNEYVYTHQERIINGTINFAGIIFGPFYYLYRKLFIIGMILLSVDIALLLMDKLYFALGCWAFFGIIFNYIYLFKARRVIKKIIKNNPNGDAYELGRISSTKGATSYTQVLAGDILEVLILIGIGYIVIGQAFMVALKELVNSYNFEAGGFDYDIIISVLDDYVPALKDTFTEINSFQLVDDTTFDVTKEFDISVIENNERFENINEKEAKLTDQSKNVIPDTIYYFKYNDRKEYSGCVVSLRAILNYDSAEAFANALEQQDKRSVVAEKEINKIDWKYYEVSSNNGMEYFYATDYKDKTIILKYEVQVNSDLECEIKRDAIINSVQIHKEENKN